MPVSSGGVLAPPRAASRGSTPHRPPFYFFDKIFHRPPGAGARKRKPRKPSAFAASPTYSRACGDIANIANQLRHYKSRERFFEKTFADSVPRKKFFTPVHAGKNVFCRS